MNGTCNYILTKMANEGRSFADVLKEAQALGYAEADPTFDVEGIDAAHKLAILSSIAFGVPINICFGHSCLTGETESGRRMRRRGGLACEASSF